MLPSLATLLTNSAWLREDRDVRDAERGGG